MSSMQRYWSRYCAQPYAAIMILILALLTHIGFIFCQTFIADDFLQYFVLTGNAQLQALGFAGATEAGTFSFALSNQFNFFDSQSSEHFHALRQYGVLPWWINDTAQLHLWRPITAFSHWLDYQLWPRSLTLMHLSSLALLVIAWTFTLTLYRILANERSVYLLALFILAADLSLISPLIWLAARNVLWVMLCLSLTLIFLHKSQQRPVYLVTALLAYLSALLSAEAGVAVGGFVAAFLLYLDDRSLALRIKILLLFVAVTLLWKFVYIQLGFGATAIGNYVDPFGDPFKVLLHCFTFYPLLLTSAFTGIDGLVTSWPLAGVGWALLCFFGFLLWRIQDRLLWFCAVSIVLSLLPYMSLYSSAPRFSVITHIAVALLFAQLLHIDWKRVFPGIVIRRTSFSLMMLLMIVHLPLSWLGTTALSIFAANGKTFNSDNVDKKYNDFSPYDILDKQVIVLNSADPFRMMFYPYRAVYKQQNLPRSIRQIAPAANTLILHRTDAKTINIEIPDGLRLSGQDVEQLLHDKRKQPNNRLFEFYGFFHDGHYAFTQGQRFTFEDMDLQILSLSAEARVTTLQLQLKHTWDDPQYVWLYWDETAQRYRPFTLPDVGDTKTLKGLLW